MLVRVRLRFQSTPLHYAQKCWFTFDTEKCRLVGDVTHLIATHFGFEKHNGIQLFMEDYLVPTNEMAGVFRDNDLIEVKVVTLSSGSSSSSSESSSPEVQPPSRKRIRAVNRKPANSQSQVNCNPTQPSVSAVNGPQPPPTVAKSTKELRVSKRKTAAGGVHLTFKSSTSSESTSEISSSEEDLPQKSVAKPPTSNRNTTGSAPSNRTASANPSPGTNAPRRGRGKGRRGRQRGRTLPSSLVIGGPNDVHSTVSTVYTNKGPPADDGSTNNHPPTGTTGESRPTTEASGGSSQPASGWDVQPTEETPVISETAKDYSTCPSLEGAPRVGDRLAFKLLELSGNCTPEVSHYKLALVLAYDHTSRRVTVKYEGPTSSGADSATSRLAQFALEQNDMIVETCPEVELELDSLIEPRLIT